MADNSDPTGRKPSKFPCIYWDGLRCRATDKFGEDTISCYNDGNCDGFGTCRGCSKYDQGGLKFDDVDGRGGHTQTPFNLQLYNLRAQIKPCCHWEGPPVSFEKKFSPDLTVDPLVVFGINYPSDVDTEAANGQLSILLDSAEIPSWLEENKSRKLYAHKEGSDENGKPYTRYNIKYLTTSDNSLVGVTISPYNYTDPLPAGYKLYPVAHRATPLFKVLGSDVSGEESALGHRATSCTLAEAAPWQEGFTDENPSAYGCNGAKPECPFYTGPRFTEVVDSKMDTGDRITAKQIMELRFYSNDWKSLKNPREEWERLFSEPDIWAWVRKLPLEEGDRIPPGPGRKDTVTGKPLVQKVTITDFDSDVPRFDVGQPKVPSTGTPAVLGLPNYPTLIKEVQSLSSSAEIVFPRNTSIDSPFIRRIFSHDQRYMYISAQFNSPTSRDYFAINLTKHPQGGLDDESFIKQVKINNPEDIIYPEVSGLPGQTFVVELVGDGSTARLNHIRIFADSGVGEEDKLEDNVVPGTFPPDNEVPSLPAGKRVFYKLDVFIELRFYHTAISQTSFRDFYGHQQIDPWVNHITQFDLTGEVLKLGYRCSVDDIYWHTINSEGKKTLYSIEEQVETTSKDSSEIDWELLPCGTVLVKFLNKKVCRVAPWSAWGVDSKNAPLYVKVRREDNPDLLEGEDTSVELELRFVDTTGKNFPANYAVFGLPSGAAPSSFNQEYDYLEVRYAYTEYRQAPLKPEDIPKLKFPADVDRVADLVPYELTRDESNLNKFKVEGTFLKVGDEKIYGCHDVLGDCYSEKALSNEEEARRVFIAGGIGEENLKGIADVLKECGEKFDDKFSSATLPDGTPATAALVSQALQDLYLKEGSQHYLFVVKDEEGRPIGVKHHPFLVQSAIAQARDVEIKYKWGAQLQHYPVHNLMILLASFYEPTSSVTWRLSRLVQEYDPLCGDHKETTPGYTGFSAFDLEVDEHGALWYPYKECLIPNYAADSETFTNPVAYEGVVEGFDGEPMKRRAYWERMRCFDKYMPAVIDYIPQLGCFWSERSTTVNANPPFIFFGYTKIRSSHMFGKWATDRESLRISRHWEKRNLEVDNETISQDEDGGLTLSLSNEFDAILYDNNRELNENTSLATPIWVHMNDGFSAVRVMGEGIENPFSHLLLQRVGNHEFGEYLYEGEDSRYDVLDVFQERDYTSTEVRSTDGSLVYLADGTTLNVDEGYKYNSHDGKDIRLSFLESGSLDDQNVWAWLVPPSDIDRGKVRVGGISLGNPSDTFFKKNFLSANHVLEGTHSIEYTPYEFDSSGNVSSYAAISLDGGPPLYIDPVSSQLIRDINSPYNPDLHEGEDYIFYLEDRILIDNRGLQRFESADGKLAATYAGVKIGSRIVVEELPHKVDKHRVIQRPGFQEQQNKYIDLEKTYKPSDTGPVSTGVVDFAGFYYVEKVEITFKHGYDSDIPAVSLYGSPLSSGEYTLLAPITSYVDSANVKRGTVQKVSFPLGILLTSINLQIGARKTNRSMVIDDISIYLRIPIPRTETIVAESPKLNVSRAKVGTHLPSSLEFYFQRSYPEFSKNYVSGAVSLDDVETGNPAVAQAGTSIKFTGRRIKDIIPTFEFTDPINNRFPYGNIDITAIDGYTEEAAHGGTVSYVGMPIQTCGKGWTLYTKDHEEDPGGSLSHKNTFNKVRPFEEMQEDLYREAGDLLGDKMSVFKNFWHPLEKEVYAKYGINLDLYNWELTLLSTVAPIDRVMRHENYGCDSAATTEYQDGKVHKVENWQARGVFHYACNAVYNWTCLDTVMNKCYAYLYEDYGTEAYNDTDVVTRFTYKFRFPPREYMSYIAAGLIDRNYTGGTFGGYGTPTSLAQAAAGGPPSSGSVNLFYNPISLFPKGPGSYQ